MNENHENHDMSPLSSALYAYESKILCYPVCPLSSDHNRGVRSAGQGWQGVAGVVLLNQTQTAASIRH